MKGNRYHTHGNVLVGQVPFHRRKDHQTYDRKCRLCKKDLTPKQTTCCSLECSRKLLKMKERAYIDIAMVKNKDKGSYD